MTSSLPSSTGFFEEAPGVRSSMRLMAMMTLLAGIASGLLTVLGKGGSDGVLVTTMFLSAAYAGKLGQKVLGESKLPQSQA